MPQPRSVEDLTAEILALYATSWEKITVREQALVNSWVGWRRVERLNRLRELRTTVEALMDHADEQALAWTLNELPAIYTIGAAAAGVGFDAFTTPDVDAINVLAGDTYSSLLDATRFVRESTKDLIRTLAREHVADKLIVGQTAEQAGRDLAASLEGRGIAAVVYKNGARHGLLDYSDVVLKTKSAEAYTIATMTQLERAGIAFVEIFDGVGCGMGSHDDPDKANGTVRPLIEAQRYPLSHPRCRRSVAGRPDVKSLREARSAQPSTTPAQQADQAEAEARRELEVAARASQRSFEAQVTRRANALLSDESNRVRSAAHARVLSRRQVTLERRARLLRRSG